jgi:hypothetical protein
MKIWRQLIILSHTVVSFKGDQHRHHQDYEEDDSGSMDDSFDNVDD